MEHMEPAISLLIITKFSDSFFVKSEISLFPFQWLEGPEPGGGGGHLVSLETPPVVNGFHRIFIYPQQN